mmetsp:Transcript_1195/g.1918  ORF Transcript_1195/g.1918 Transcript_1195/m.1918 type:complete len:84 (+) Transcript_1195:3136-3387(+)
MIKRFSFQLKNVATRELFINRFTPWKIRFNRNPKLLSERVVCVFKYVGDANSVHGTQNTDAKKESERDGSMDSPVKTKYPPLH